MIQLLSKTISFDEFVAWYPEYSETHYELRHGSILEMPKPTGKHSKVAGFIISQLSIEISRQQLPYFIPRECIVRPLQKESGYEPDLIVLDERQIDEDPRWEQESIILRGQSVGLIVEVVSTNWSDDYALKFEDYEELGIQEYWIVDYLGLGGRRYIGSPKQPTISIYQLEEGVYQGKRYRKDEKLQSGLFPHLDLTAEQVFSKGL